MDILIVDDRPANLRLLRFILEDAGHKVAEAADGVEALEILNRVEVDAIVSDILMPRMDGYRLCREVRTSERLCATPFIFYTSTYTSPSDRRLCREVGGDFYLQKPATSEAMLAALRDATQSGRPRTRYAIAPEVEAEVIKEYNARLVFKLEEKISELELQNTVLETAANAIVITDPRGVILRVNPAFTKLSGYSAVETIGQTPRLLKSGQHDEAFYRDLWDTILSGETWQGEFINRRKDGSLYLGEQTITPVRTRPGAITHFIGIMNDITARRRAEGESRRTADLLRAVADGIGDAVFVKDPQGRYLLCNQSASRFIGLGVTEILGRDDSELFDAEGAAQVMANDRVVRESGLAQTTEEYLTAAGVARTYLATKAPYRDAQGNVIGTIGISHDITERKQNEERIREQAAMLDCAHEAIIVRDIETRRIRYWNHGAERLYGWTAEEAQGRDIAELICVDPEVPEAVTREILASGERRGEYEHKTKAGGVMTVRSHATLVRDAGGAPKAVLVINFDITEQKALEARFLRAQRMESIGTLAGGIAHDLNNVLSPIMMALEVMKMRFPDEESQGLIDILSTSAQRGSDMVRQVLSFARGVEGRRMEVQIKHLVKDIERTVRDTFLKNIEMRTDIPRDLWTVTGDPTQIHQVLLNLCVNARDAMPEGGTLNIVARNLTLDEQYVGMNAEAKPGSYVLLQVEDSGTGMSADVIEKIFDPFFTTKPIGKGTGLGLSTSLAIVKSHGGFFRVESEKERGTTFKVYLPAETESSAETANETVLELPRGQGELVLVVDDEPAVRQVTQQTLLAFGYRVVLATDGIDALAIYARQGAEIAVVLTDMMMPVMGGAATIEVLKRMNPKVRIIAASGLSTDGQGAHAVRLGVTHFLPKPYTAETLLKVLKDVLSPE